jgi:ElaB/YqjD/DUF883 family membrane-anchored ribosome-binding protein
MPSSDSSQPNELLTDLRRLLSEAEKLVGDSFVENRDEAVGALRHKIETAQARLTEFCACAKTRVIDGAHKADSTIRANPYQTIALAAGVGLVLGLALGRRSRRD